MKRKKTDIDTNHTFLLYMRRKFNEYIYTVPRPIFLRKIIFFLEKMIYNIHTRIYKSYIVIINLFISTPKISDTEKTLQYILDNKCSVSRYGDGELRQCYFEYNIGFQSYSPQLSKELRRVLFNDSTDLNHICCIPYTYVSLSNLNQSAASFWKDIIVYSKRLFVKKLPQKQYYDALCTRPYLDWADKSKCEHRFNLWKEVWNNRKILIVEGEYSRLGEGNDLFANTKEIKRIIVPSRDSFRVYKELLTSVKKHADNYELILIALGPTATVLAYDLAKDGYWAIDVGHIDIEYMWFKMGVLDKTPVPGRHINEIQYQDDEYVCSDKYYESIILKIV